VHVTALVAVARVLGAGGQDVEAVLRRHATDLGKPGRDEVFGWGLARGAELCARVAARG
jgi:hypothetical protein